MIYLQNIFGAFIAILFISVACAMTSNDDENQAPNLEEVAADKRAKFTRPCKLEFFEAGNFIQAHRTACSHS